MASTFPEQKLTTAQIKKQYGSFENFALATLSSVENVGGAFGIGLSNEYFEKQVYLDLVDGKLDLKRLEHVLNPLKDETPSAPANLRYYDVITPILEELKGEELKRPLRFSASVVNEAAVSRFLDEKNKEFDRLIDANLSTYVAKLASMQAQQDPVKGEGQEELPPPDVSKIWANLNTTFKDKVDIASNHLLSYLVEYLDIERVFNDGWSTFNSIGDNIYYTGIRNGEPIVRLVDGLNFDYDRSGSIEDSTWAIEFRRMSIGQVMDEYGDILNENPKLIDEIEALRGNHMYSTIGTNDNKINGTNVYVTDFTWMGMARIGFVTYELDGEILTKQVNDTYKVLDDEEVEWVWVNEVYECIRIGAELIISAGVRKNQYRSLENLQKTRLPYTGISDINYSIVKRVEPLIYDFCMYQYRMELEIAKAMGRVLVIDEAQISNKNGMSVSRWFHFLKSHGVAFINSRDESQLAEHDRNSNKFNQTAALDLAIGQSVTQYINLLIDVETRIEKLSGINDQRKGNIAASETAYGIQASLEQSGNITANRFYRHDLIKQQVLTNLVEEAKVAWRGGKKLKYIAGETTEVFTLLPAHLENSEIGIFMTNNSQDMLVKAKINEYATAGIQNGQVKMSDMARAIKTNSVNEAISILEKSFEDMQAAAQKAQQEQQAAAQEHAEMMYQRELMDKQMERDFIASEANLDRTARMAEARLKALGNQSDVGIAESINEEADAALKTTEMLYNAHIKRRELDQKDRHKQDELSLKSRELDIKEKAIDTSYKIAKENKNKHDK